MIDAIASTDGYGSGEGRARLVTIVRPLSWSPLMASLLM